MPIADKKPVKKKPFEKKHISLIVNGQTYKLDTGHNPGQVNPSHTLAYTLRETLNLTGTKVSCNSGACGSCTVLMDGKAIVSCMTLTIECDKKRITTIEGLKDSATDTLDPIQKAFINHTAFQCGFCTPGIIMSTKALLSENPHPNENDIKEALSGHFCRCISHYQVINAVVEVSKQTEKEQAK